MGALQMRPYQQAAREAIHAEWNDGRRRTLLVLPTGTGKTIVFAAVTEDQVRSGSRVLVLAHRGELLEQAADKIKRSTGLASAVEKRTDLFDSWCRSSKAQSLQRPARLE
ncbi:MAG: DEAD/DEAH box helicase family protein [Ruthenibacterium lactatiformans]